MIKPSDLIDKVPLEKTKQYIESHDFPKNLELYAKHLCGRFDTNKPSQTTHLLLNKPVVPHKSSIVKSLTVSLAESIMLQHSQKNKLKVKYTIILYITNCIN